MTFRLTTVIVATLTFLCAPSVEATPFGLATTAQWAVNGLNCSAAGTSVADCTQDVTFFDPQRQVALNDHLIATSTAGFGQLFTTLRSSQWSTGFYFPRMLGTASFFDEFLVSGGTGTGYIQYLFAGTLNQNAEVPEARLTLSHNGTTLTAFESVAQSVFNQPFTYTSPLLPFDWGQVIQFSAALSQQLLSSPGDFESGSMSASLIGINVFGGGGQLPIGAFSFNAASGASYPLATPEPASALLLATAAGALAARRYRRRWLSRP